MNTINKTETRPRFAENPYYVEYETLLKRLHELIAMGEGDSDAADAIRDEMELPYRHLNSAEHDRLDGLSADLYMLQNDEVFEPATPQELLTIRQDLDDAFYSEDWTKLLALLRKGPKHFEPDEFAFARAIAYERLGHIDTALLFIRCAAELKPSDFDYKGYTVNYAARIGKAYLYKELAITCMEAGSSIGTIFFGIEALIAVASENKSVIEMQDVCERVIPELIKLTHHPDFEELLPQSKGNIYSLCSFCFGFLAQMMEEAQDTRNGISLEPFNRVLYSVPYNNFATASAKPFVRGMLAK